MREVKLRRYKNVIYELYCIETNTYYIGQTIKPLNDRISKHFSDAKRGRKQILYKDIRKYGRDSFTYKAIEEVQNRENLDSRERFWIDEYIKNGFVLYNNEFGGRKDINVPYKTRVRMAVKKGTKPFSVYDINKKLVGRFEKLNDAKDKLGVHFTNSMVKNGYQSKGLIAIYDEDFSEEKLSKIVNGLEVTKSGLIRKYRDLSGENNPMYKKGKHFYAYDSNMKFIKEFFTYSDCIEELGVSVWSIKEYMDKNKPCQKGYYFTTNCGLREIGKEPSYD
jgi:group I intron endonuclease